jgi:hypothetical protein
MFAPAAQTCDEYFTIFIGIRFDIRDAWGYTRPGKHTKNDGTSPSLIGKSTISMGHVQ